MNNKHNPYFFSFFLAVLVGFSTYSIFGLFGAVDGYVEHYGAANVLGVDEIAAEEVVDPVDLLDKEKPVFADLDSEHPNRLALEFLYYEGIVSAEDHNVRPNDAVSRAEFAKMVMEAGDFDYSQYANLENCFVDVKSVSEHWFAPFVCSANAEGLFGGFADGTFRPAESINRAEAAKVVLAAFGYGVGDYESSSFKDVNEEDWYFDVAEAARVNGLISDDLIFDGGKIMTRGDVAQMIYNAGYATL